MTCPRLGPRAIDNIGTKVLVNKMLQKQWCHEQKLFPPKGHSLYQISSKMLPGSKVITLVGKKKEKRWPGWD